MTAIEIRGLNLAASGTPLLVDVNLAVEAGEFAGLIGPNGGGKTTLLHVILGELKGWTGEVLVFGQRVGTREFDRTVLGFVPQRDYFTVDFPATPLDVALMGRVPGRGLVRRLTAADREAAAEAVRTVGLADQARQPMGRLSGGQQQRAFIARALAGRPRLLLLDEPMTGVDKSGESDFFALLEKLNREGLTIVMASHDLTTVARRCGKIACLNRRLHCHAAPGEIDHARLAELYGRNWELFIHGEVPHRVVEKHGGAAAGQQSGNGTPHPLAPPAGHS